MKLTDWFPPDVAPVRAGVYEVGVGLKPWYRWIDTDGTQHIGEKSPRLAALFAKSIDVPPASWRGLAADPYRAPGGDGESGKGFGG